MMYTEEWYRFLGSTQKVESSKALARSKQRWGNPAAENHNQQQTNQLNKILSVSSVLQHFMECSIFHKMPGKVPFLDVWKPHFRFSLNCKIRPLFLQVSCTYPLTFYTYNNLTHWLQLGTEYATICSCLGEK